MIIKLFYTFRIRVIFLSLSLLSSSRMRFIFEVWKILVKGMLGPLQSCYWGQYCGLFHIQIASSCIYFALWLAKMRLDMIKMQILWNLECKFYWNWELFLHHKRSKGLIFNFMKSHNLLSWMKKELSGDIITWFSWHEGAVWQVRQLGVCGAVERSVRDL